MAYFFKCLHRSFCTACCFFVGLVFAEEKQVFAHYMVCCPVGGGDSSVEDYSQEILIAQSSGLDGFVLNCGGWSEAEPHYKARVTKIYEAAKQLETGFKLFISADMCCGLTLEEVKDMVDSFKAHPNQFKWEGRTVLSSFDGWSEFTDFMHNGFDGAAEVFFIPFYYPQPAEENTGLDGLVQIYNANPTIDGYFSFGAAGRPSEIIDSCRVAAEFWKSKGKLYMHPITPYYRGLRGNYRVYEHEGFAGMMKQWINAIEVGADWVQIVTWNDWSEASYVVPFGPVNKTDFRDGYWGKLLSHEAYLGASEYFIQWYKSGVKPDILEDKVFYFYRLSSREVPWRGDVLGTPKGYPSNSRTLQDLLYCTAFLREAATLLVDLGGDVTTFELDAGVHNISVDMRSGYPRFGLVRNGSLIIDKFGEMEIDPDDNWANFNYFSGVALAGRDLMGVGWKESFDSNSISNRIVPELENAFNVDPNKGYSTIRVSDFEMNDGARLRFLGGGDSGIVSSRIVLKATLQTDFRFASLDGRSDEPSELGAFDIIGGKLYGNGELIGEVSVGNEYTISLRHEFRSENLVCYGTVSSQDKLLVEDVVLFNGPVLNTMVTESFLFLTGASAEMIIDEIEVTVSDVEPKTPSGLEIQ